MIEDLKGKIRDVLEKDSDINAHLDGNAMIIDCEGCGFAPEPGSKECLRCMVVNMSELSGTERIILRSGCDTEVSGRSADVVRRISSLKRWSIPLESGERKCRRCMHSRRAMMMNLWDGFPEMDFERAESVLEMKLVKEECSRCHEMSQRALYQLRSDMERLVSEMA